jgi:hypothetical protein
VVGIPYALTYTTTVTGRIPKLVRCEQCGFEYVYLLEATAAGAGTSVLFLDNEGAYQRSLAQAQALMHQELVGGSDVIPCPSCGTVQAHMLPRARQDYRHWMYTAGVFAMAAAGILVLPAVVYTLIDSTTTGMSGVTAALIVGMATLFCVGLGLIQLRVRMAAAYDPNAEPVETRRQKGQEYAISKDDFLKEAGLAPPMAAASNDEHVERHE